MRLSCRAVESVTEKSHKELCNFQMEDTSPQEAQKKKKKKSMIYQSTKFQLLVSAKDLCVFVYCLRNVPAAQPPWPGG